MSKVWRSALVAGRDTVPVTDDGPAPTPEPRISYAERDRVLAVLRAHTAEGRLTLDEFSERAEAVVAARTSADLEPLTADLPPAEIRRKAVTRWTVAIMGGSHRRGRWRVADSTNAVAVMGECRLDLRAAEFEGKTITIRAVAVMGSVEIVVPDGIEVELTGLPIMGASSLKVRDVPAVPGSPLIRVRALALMGDVTVRSRSRTSRSSGSRGDDGGEQFVK